MAVAKVTESIASSPKSFEDAVAKGVARANKTLNNVKGRLDRRAEGEVRQGPRHRVPRDDARDVRAQGLTSASGLAVKPTSSR